MDFLVSYGKVINFLLPLLAKTQFFHVYTKGQKKILVLEKLPHSLPALAIKAYPHMMLHTQPMKHNAKAICNHPTQKLIQKVPNLPPPDCPTLPMHKTQKPPIIVPVHKIATLQCFSCCRRSFCFILSSWQCATYGEEITTRNNFVLLLRSSVGYLSK